MYINYYRNAFALKVLYSLPLSCCRRHRHWLWFRLMWLKINANILIATLQRSGERERERARSSMSCRNVSTLIFILTAFMPCKYSFAARICLLYAVSVCMMSACVHVSVYLRIYLFFFCLPACLQSIN